MKKEKEKVYFQIYKTPILSFLHLLLLLPHL